MAQKPNLTPVVNLTKIIIGLTLFFWGMFKWYKWYGWEKALILYCIIYGLSTIYSTKD